MMIPAADGQSQRREGEGSRGSASPCPRSLLSSGETDQRGDTFLPLKATGIAPHYFYPQAQMYVVPLTKESEIFLDIKIHMTSCL